MMRRLALVLALTATPALADTSGPFDPGASYLGACDPLTGQPRDIWGLMQPAARQYAVTMPDLAQLLIIGAGTPRSGAHVEDPTSSWLPPISLPASGWVMLGGLAVLAVIAIRRARRG